MLRMRLTRTGARKRPSYRVIVADSRAPRDGRHVEILGFYDPMTKPSTVRIDTDRAVQWLRNGAEPTDTVRVLLRHAGVLKAWEELRLADKRERKEQAAAREESRAAKMAAAAARRERRAAGTTRPPARAARTAAATADAAETEASPTKRTARTATKAAATGTKTAAKTASAAGDKPKRTSRAKAGT